MGRKRRNRQVVPDRERGVVVGVDVSKRWIDYGAFGQEWRGRVRQAGQDADGFEALQASLAQLKGEGHEVWVAFEPTGSYSSCLREWLVRGGWRVVQVNPYHVKRTKEVRDNSPGKSDRKDCGVIADLVWSGCYQQVVLVQGVYAELRGAYGQWCRLRKKHTSIASEFQALLAEWFPELTQIFKDATCKTVRTVVSGYQSPQQVANARLGRLRSRIRAKVSAPMGARAKAIRQAAKRSVAVVEGHRARGGHLRDLLAELELIEQQQDQVHQEMASLVGEAPEGPALLSLPRTNVITVAGLLGECGPLDGFASYGRLEKHVGLNLYEISSGQHQGKHRISKRGRSRARQALYLMARGQIKEGGLCWELAQQLRAHGKKSPQIRVAAARKLLRLLYRLACTKEAFDPQRWVTGVSTADGHVRHQGTPQSLAA
jgi:transposase